MVVRSAFNTALGTCMLLCAVCPFVPAVLSASYEGLELKAINGGDIGTWTKHREAAWAVLGNLSYCQTEARTATNDAAQIRFNALLERTALNMDTAFDLYRCSIVADPLYSQAWIEVADLIIYKANENDGTLWADALVRFRLLFLRFAVACTHLHRCDQAVQLCRLYSSM